jgi:hypothetical protein
MSFVKSGHGLRMKTPPLLSASVSAHCYAEMDLDLQFLRMYSIWRRREEKNLEESSSSRPSLGNRTIRLIHSGMSPAPNRQPTQREPTDDIR